MLPDVSTKPAAVTPKSPNPFIAGAVVAFILVTGVTVAILVGNASRTTAVASARPAGVTSTGGGIVANTTPAKAGVPTLDVYEDFQCPTCAAFERALGPAIASLATTGDIKLVVHTLSFLDENLKNDSSSRAANAVACAADAGKFLEYHAVVFAGQPTKEGAGYSNGVLSEFATNSGITDKALTTWQKCATNGQHAQYVADVQTAAEKAGVNSTPTVKLNGKNITATLANVTDLRAMVKAATK